MREWLTIIIVVLILGILLDGWRRMRNARRDTLKVSRSVYRPKPSDKKPQVPEERESSPFSSELPNGGARVVGSRNPATDAVRKEKPGAPKNSRREFSSGAPLKSQQKYKQDADPLDPDWSDSDIEPEAQPKPAWKAAPEANPRHADYPTTEDQNTAEQEPEIAVSEPVQAPVRRAEPDEESARIPQQVTLNLDESVPLLMESVEDDEQETEPSRDKRAGTHSPKARSKKDAAHQGSMARDFAIESDDERIEPTLGSDANLANLDSTDLDASDTEDLDIEPDLPQAAPAKSKTKETKATLKPEPAPISVEDEEPGEPEEVLIINVMARPGHYFQGEPLLQEIFDAGMRYGSMNIFHRYRDARGGGPILFSLANMVKPGTFDLDAMEEFQTPGVSLFMTLPMSGDSLEAFDLMLDTAKAIAENLNGELKDENRSVMTKQTMEHDRQRVLEFERRQLSRAHH